MYKPIALLLFALSPSVMLAVDGQILINQSTVMAAGGFPYVISQPGSYKLSGNLTVPANTDGIHILVSNVTLNLNGFSITAPVGMHTYGIVTVLPPTGGQPSAITIRNGMIRGFQYPVSNSIASAAANLNFGTSWALESLTLIWGSSGGIGTAYLGVFGRVEHVSAEDINIAVPCPVVVAFTIAAQIDTVASPYSSDTCVYTGNSTIYH